jgi:DNA-binding CsgD family transcriptional regulator
LRARYNRPGGEVIAKTDSGSLTEASGSVRPHVNGTISADQMLDRLNRSVSAQDVASAAMALCDYVGAEGYLLARHELNSEAGLDNIISSNWPFDLVRNRGRELLARLSRSTELEKCLSVLNPAFSLLVDDKNGADQSGREYCTIIFNAGRTRYCLMFICPQDVILSQQRLRETGLLAGYLASLMFRDTVRSARDMDLTDRELECLYWIAEGKTSDEIATIIGISKNTINNYITSVMRKTATRTRSEAIAYAVRHNLV